jgi:RND family efflux transporter MFP subunit
MLLVSRSAVSRPVSEIGAAILLATSLFLSVPVPSGAAEALALQPAQIKALGITVQPVQGSGQNSRQGHLPAKVVIPNSQLRFVSAPLPGLVESLQVATGMTVQAGQVVAEMLSPQVLELRRELTQAESQSTLAQQQLVRDEQLFKAGVIAEARLQATRATAVQAAAQASERRQALRLAGAASKAGSGTGSHASEGRLRLVAPISGVVLEQQANVGQRLEAAAPIYRIGKLDPLQLEIQVPVALAGQLREGLRVSVAAAEASGNVIAVGRAVEAGSQSLLVRARIDKNASKLRPGQMVEAEIALSAGKAGDKPNDKSAAFTLPAAALVRHQSRDWVFVQHGGGRYLPVAVQVMQRSGDQVQVGGLAGSETVVVQGISGLKAIWTGVGRD